MLFSFSFAVVAEPDSDEEDCEDIGYSYVDVQELMKSNANYYDKEINCLKICFLFISKIHFKSSIIFFSIRCQQ